MQKNEMRAGWSTVVVLIMMFMVFALTVTVTAIVGIMILRSFPAAAENLGIGREKELKCEPCEAQGVVEKDIYYPNVTILDSTLQIEGELNKKEVMQLLQSKRHELRGCYGPQLKKNQNLKGEFGLQFTVIQSGKVRVAIENKTKFPNQSVKKCIIKEVESWKLPGNYRGLNIVKVDILFAPVTNTGTY